MAIVTRDWICQTIQERILSGELRPGMRLSEVSMAKELNVSRTPLREAFSTLISQGILTRLPTGAVFVREVTGEEVRDIYEMRLWLEPGAAQVAAEKISESQLQILRECCEKGTRLCERIGDGTIPVSEYAQCQYVHMVEIDIPFHLTLCEATGNSILHPFMRRLRILQRSWIPLPIRTFSAEDYPRVTQEHWEIYEAVACHEGLLALERVQRHVAHALDKVMVLIEQEKRVTMGDCSKISELIRSRVPVVPVTDS
ncbi:MAG: GntR family transcriptional regulator [Planctomycetia bacterium]|nr:GntR family transcriptional regulator [Planctomycetia bacterium]